MCVCDGLAIDSARALPTESRRGTEQAKTHQQDGGRLGHLCHHGPNAATHAANDAATNATNAPRSAVSRSAYWRSTARRARRRTDVGCSHATGWSGSGAGGSTTGRSVVGRSGSAGAARGSRRRSATPTAVASTTVVTFLDRLHALPIGTVRDFGCRVLSGSVSRNTGTAGAPAAPEPATTAADERGERRTKVCQLRLSIVEIPSRFGE